MMRTVLLSILSLSLLTGCGESKEKKEFMRDCMRSGGSDSACECSYDRIAKSYGRHWTSQEYLPADPDFNRRVASTVVQCAMANR